MCLCPLIGDKSCRSDIVLTNAFCLHTHPLTQTLHVSKESITNQYYTLLHTGAPYKYNPAGAKFLEWVYGAFSRREFIGLKAQEIRSFVYVQDVVNVILRLMEKYCVMGGSSGGVCSVGSVRGVYNVGGPVPLSRLDVARSLCNVLSSEINIVAAPSMGVMVREAPYSNAPWKVYVMDPPAGDSSTSNAVSSGFVSVGPSNTTTSASLVQISPVNAPIAVHGELRSPRDISMDSTTTVDVLGVTFTPIEEILLGSLNVH